MAGLEILILDKLQARMAPGRTYEPDELEAAGLVPDPDGSPNDHWHLRVPVRRRYASREDVAAYATRNYPGTPVTEIPVSELGTLVKDHLDYGTYFRLHYIEKIPVQGEPVPDGRMDRRSVAAWKRCGKFSDCPALLERLENALEMCRQRRGAAIFIRYDKE